MITTCTGCQTRYRLDDSKVPHRVIRLRCPQCRAVFKMDGTATASVALEPDRLEFEGGGGGVFDDGAGAAFPGGASDLTLDPGAPIPEERQSPAAATVERSPDTGGSAPQQSGTSATSTAVAEESTRKRRRRDKAEMLARALVSDILVYNREARDQALAEGNLLEALGPEIKKSWELYKEKVTPEVANSTNYFRDALNEILAEGEQLF